MSEVNSHQTASGQRIAYNRIRAKGERPDAIGSAWPGVVFLGGFHSDMTGTKATYLEDFARRTGRSYLRFDYSGHGQSSGQFEDGTIGAWARDAADIIAAQSEGPQILVGSSMGGWISMILARRIPRRIAGIVGIAAAPDFTEDSMWDGFSDAQKHELETTGAVSLPSEYSDEPYLVTKALIADGREHLVLRDPLHLPFPVRLLHGTADTDVPLSVSLRLLDHGDSPDMRLTLVKGADHRFNAPYQLAMVTQAIEDITAPDTDQ